MGIRGSIKLELETWIRFVRTFRIFYDDGSCYVPAQPIYALVAIITYAVSVAPVQNEVFFIDLC
jgi:hypothetical protein